MIYFGETVTADAQGQAWRGQTCEHCGQQFYYRVDFTATGSAHNPYYLDPNSQQRAEREAEALLDQALRREVVPVPCPHCTLYQRDMVPAVRAAQLPRMRLAARALLGLAPVAALLGCMISGAAGGGVAVALVPVLPAVCLIAGVGLLVKRGRRLAAYDPNAEDYLRLRKREAAACALKPEEFARLRVAALAAPPRGGQLVGRNCARCGQRISCDIDGAFCRACGAPVHHSCARPADETGCRVCGAAAGQERRPGAEPGAAPDRC
jgi:hypothetical protein